MKKFIYSLTAIALVLTACHKETQTASQKTYQFTVSASLPSETKSVAIDGITCQRSFQLTDRIFVYNKTKKRSYSGYLQPVSINAAGNECSLSGSLSGSEISVNDELLLMYKITNYGVQIFYNYQTQDGSPETVLDGAEATVTVAACENGAITMTAPAAFANVQSIFRFKFSDRDSNPLTVSEVRIESQKKGLTRNYFPCNNDNKYFYEWSTFTISNPTSDYVYFALPVNESESEGDVLDFKVTDNAQEYYRGRVNAKSGGFENGKYYYNNAPIPLTKTIKPHITEMVPANTSVTYDKYKSICTIDAGDQDLSFKLDGQTIEYGIKLIANNITITLDNITAHSDFTKEPFFSSTGDLLLNIRGTNSITCNYMYSSILLSGNYLKIKGEGTLNITSKLNVNNGIYALNHSHKSDPASNLAANGYVVTRSETINNPNGTYSWTYTVRPE